jgi:hypothetical protein
MKPEIFYSESEIEYIAIIEDGFITDIACSSKDSVMWDKVSIRQNDFMIDQPPPPFPFQINIDSYSKKLQAQDLALYTHWPVHTKEFWDLLNET